MALIRCKGCGNPVSSKSKACPICGEPIASATSTTPTTPETKPMTLNDIIAQQNRERTINDIHTSAEDATPKAPTHEEAPKEEIPTPKVEPTPILEQPTPTRYDEPREDYPRDAEYDDLNAELERSNRSLKGFKMIALVLVLLLIPAAYFGISYGLKYKTIEGDYAIVESARQLFEEQNSMLQRDAESLVAELESLKDRNDTMMVKYQEAVVMLEQLQKEKTYNYNQLAKYKREVETLRGVMKGYLKQIDSLNTINSNLQAQNVAYKKEISTAQLRADVAEEKADELNTKVRIGAVIRASGIRMFALNDKSKEVRRIRQAKRLRVDFDLTANELAEPGEKSIYICITPPDGYVLSSNEVIAFNYEGSEMMASAMRKVDYENQSVPVSIFYDGVAFEAGTYKVDIYIDGRHSGSQETYFE